MQQWGAESTAITFDEVSMERSKSFVKALQELKNLRPQLYSAVEYCEKSYLHNERKQMMIRSLRRWGKLACCTYTCCRKNPFSGAMMMSLVCELPTGLVYFISSVMGLSCWSFGGFIPIKLA